MENSQSLSRRRKFLKQSLALVLSFSATPAMARITRSSGIISNDKKDPLPAELVSQFVRAAHLDLNKVKEMLTKEPMLVNGCWDWGGGDFETGLGGASHMGNRDIANYLLDNNARIDIFCAAMLGDKKVVESLIKSDPGIANVTGPHGYPLLYHVAVSGEVSIAKSLISHINKERISADCNRSLHAAVRGGHHSMTEWLFANGANDPDTKDFAGNTMLQIAEKKDDKKMVMLLKKYGAK